MATKRPGSRISATTRSSTFRSSASGSSRHIAAFWIRKPSRLAAEIDALQKQAKSTDDKANIEKQIKEKTAALARNKAARNHASQENFDKLSPREKSLHARAFCTNSGDPDYRQLASLSYDEAGTRREMQIPRGDLLHQFREDCKSGNLPTVSWIVAPSDSPIIPARPGSAPGTSRKCSTS